jgi:hypothetical protein
MKTSGDKVGLALESPGIASVESLLAVTRSMDLPYGTISLIFAVSVTSFRNQILLDVSPCSVPAPEPVRVLNLWPKESLSESDSSILLGMYTFSLSSSFRDPL